MTSGKGQKNEGYVAAYDATQRLHALLAAKRAASEQQEDRYAAQGQALFQIRELARAGFHAPAGWDGRGFRAAVVHGLPSYGGRGERWDEVKEIESGYTFDHLRGRGLSLSTPSTIQRLKT